SKRQVYLGTPATLSTAERSRTATDRKRALPPQGCPFLNESADHRWHDAVTIDAFVFVEGAIVMARGVNKVIIVGNLGADPPPRAMPSGTTGANPRIATTENWKDRQSGEQQERTEWHRVALFGRLAEVAAEYLRKGSQVYIEGSLRTRKWQDKQGNERYSTEIVGNELQMLGGRGGGGGAGGGGAPS